MPAGTCAAGFGITYVFATTYVDSARKTYPLKGAEAGRIQGPKVFLKKFIY
jgi:hypothetical protein